MFEFHGWARVESTSGRSIWRDDGLYYPDDDLLCAELNTQLNILGSTSRECIDLRHTVNGLLSLTLSGLRNHRDKSVFYLFEWLAENAKRSTGLLFSRDDEDSDRVYNPQTQFRVYRLSRGEFKELDELFEMPLNPERPPAETDFKKLGADRDNTT